MNQQQRLSAAKKACLERLRTALEDFEQIDDFSFASLEDVDGEDVWVEVKLIAKKNFDIDDAIEEFEFKQSLNKENESKASES